MSTCCLPEKAETSLSESRNHLYMHTMSVSLDCPSDAVTQRWGLSFLPVFSSAILVTSPFITLVEAVYTLVLGSATPVGTPGLPAPTVGPPQATTLITSAISGPMPTTSRKVHLHHHLHLHLHPLLLQSLQTKPLPWWLQVYAGGRDKGAAVNVVRYFVMRYNEANRIVIAYNDEMSVGHQGISFHQARLPDGLQAMIKHDDYSNLDSKWSIPFTYSDVSFAHDCWVDLSHQGLSLLFDERGSGSLSNYMSISPRLCVHRPETPSQ